MIEADVTPSNVRRGKERMRRSLRVSLFAAAGVMLISGAAVALRDRGAQAQAGVTVAIQAPANGQP